MRAVKLFVVLVFASVLMIGCATKPKVMPTTDKAPVQDEEVKKGSYVVNKADTLWDISGKGRIYGDPFSWPLLYKANRDSIEDPDLIEIDQQLDVDKNVSNDEMEEARKKAMETPPYQRHANPRKTLPLKY